MVTAGILYYTDNRLNLHLANRCREQLKVAVGDKPIVSISLKPIDFGTNIPIPLKRGKITLCKQILIGLEMLDTDIVFFAEHDVLYHPSHFDFIPDRTDAYFYNMNFWSVRYQDGFAVQYDQKYLSQLCAYRQTLINHFRMRLELYRTQGIPKRMSFEPGVIGEAWVNVDDVPALEWRSKCPNADIRDHGRNATKSKWSLKEFKKERHCQNWKETYNVPYWGKLDFK